ncbi:MAG: SOS response-associated peptidase [Micrococcales bacterium]
MCGRFVVAKTSGLIATIFEVDEVIEETPVSYNIAPTNQISMVVDRSFKDGSPDSRELHSARWGLVPRWAKSPSESAPLINARIETALEKPSFKEATEKRRCLIPASGYYEWLTDGDKKIPYYVNAGDDGMFGFAGLYEWWADPNKKPDDPTRWLLSATILTKPGVKELAHIHERTPVFLNGDTIDHWLDNGEPAEINLLKEIARGSDEIAQEALFYRVSTEVNSVKNSGRALINPL